MEQIDQYLEILSNTHNVELLPPDYNNILEAEINDYIERMRKCSTIEEADKIIVKLGFYQEKLAKLNFKYNVPLSKKIGLIIRYLDRADDLETRRFFLTQSQIFWH